MKMQFDDGLRFCFAPAVRRVLRWTGPECRMTLTLNTAPNTRLSATGLAAEFGLPW